MGSSRPWPLFDLRVESPRLVLRYADDSDLETLAGFRSNLVLQPGAEPFDGDSSFYSDDPEAAARKSLTGEWGARGRTSPDWWHLSFAVVVDDEVVGQQNITGADFKNLRTVNSFSFLARAHQGRGLGKEMRSAILHLAFAGLGALRAESDAFHDNVASTGVSRSLGYLDNGTMLAPRPSGAALMLRFLMTRELWDTTRRADIRIDGLDGALSVLGLESAP
jgi:RimJ/RimL family protein N-acetyltransferase